MRSTKHFGNTINLVSEGKLSLIGGFNMFSIWRRDGPQTAPIASVVVTPRGNCPRADTYSISGPIYEQPHDKQANVCLQSRLTLLDVEMLHRLTETFACVINRVFFFKRFTMLNRCLYPPKLKYLFTLLTLRTSANNSRNVQTFNVGITITLGN